MAKMPKEFRAVFFDDGWEFDAPVVVYFPHRYRRFEIANNAGGIERAIEDICERIALGEEPNDGDLDAECEWRHWGPRGFARRRGEHETWTVDWTIYRDGQLDYTLTRQPKVRGRKVGGE